MQNLLHFLRLKGVRKTEAGSGLPLGEGDDAELRGLARAMEVEAKEDEDFMAFIERVERNPMGELRALLESWGGSKRLTVGGTPLQPAELHELRNSGVFEEQGRDPLHVPIALRGATLAQKQVKGEAATVPNFVGEQALGDEDDDGAPYATHAPGFVEADWSGDAEVSRPSTVQEGAALGRRARAETVDLPTKLAELDHVSEMERIKALLDERDPAPLAHESTLQLLKLLRSSDRTIGPYLPSPGGGTPEEPASSQGSQEPGACV